MALLEATTAYGAVAGQPTGYQASTIFKGTPYAKPPVGDRRWRAPEPPEPWEGVRECYAYSPIPMQKRPDEGTFYRREFYPIPWPMSEDCLYANVVTPAESPDERLPVALWIYGGAFVQGYAQKLETDGEAFAQRGVIYVSFNYRVGPFGFLSAPETSDDAVGITPNCGLLDQIAALDWVRENIAAFGGDPDRITIMGQSAGAMSVYDLLCSPLTKGKIAGAVMESGGGPMPHMNVDETSRVRTASFLDACGGLEAARALPAEDLFAKWLDHLAANPPAGTALSPVTGDDVLPCTIENAFRAGAFADVPCIIGTVADEDKSNGTPANMLRDGFYSGTLAFCEKQAEEGRIPAFMYHITNCPPGDEEFGAFHSSEHMYIFQTFLRSWRPYTGADFDLSRAMCTYWTNFVKTGDPNGDDLPTWRAYGTERAECMRFDRTQPCEMIEPPAFDGAAHALAEDVLGRTFGR